VDPPDPLAPPPSPPYIVCVPGRPDGTHTAGPLRPLAWGAAAVLLFAGAGLAAVLAVEAGPTADSTSRANATAPAVAAEPAASTPEEHLARGRRLVEANGAGVAGASREGLLEAERDLRAAIDGGAQDGAEAHRLLARTYAALAQDWADGPQERDRWEARRREILRAAVDADGADAKARYEYALTLPDRAERIEQLEASVKLDPADAVARRALAEDLLESDREEEGARQLVEAVMLSDRAALEEHGQALMYLLRSHGREADEQRVRERMQELGI
jgi:hypothetical protein